MFYFFSSTSTPIGFQQRVHHKQILQQIHVFLSQEVIRLSLNFSGGLLLIGHLIYLHRISQKYHNFRQTDGFPRHVFITAAYISSVIRPSTFPIIESSKKVYVFREVDGLVFCPVGKWTKASAVGLCRTYHWVTHIR